MSDRSFGLALALSLLWPSGLAAQSAAAWRDSADRLAAQWRALRDSLLEGDSTVKEVARRDDLVIGAPDRLRAQAATALERLVEVRRRWFGGPGAVPSRSGFRIVLRIQRADGELSVVVLSGLPDTGTARRAERVTRRGELAEALIDGYGEMMFGSLGPPMQKWLQLTPPLSMPDRERRYITMYAVVTGTGAAQRGCVAGRIPDCAYALQLGPPLTTEAGGGYPALVRADLLLTALEQGGPEAWTRLRGLGNESAGPALAAAAGTSLDSLLTRWTGGVLALRPTERPIRPPGVILALAWTILAVGGILLGARSRWM